MKKKGHIISAAFMAMLICTSCLLAGCKVQEKKDNPDQSAAYDNLSGKTLKAGDGSLLIMNEDKSYLWYQKEAVTDDNYYQGTYEIYVGDKAIEVLDGMTQYGVTRLEQEALIKRNADKGVTADDWYVMVQTRTFRKVSGKETAENTKIVYAGFYYKEQKTYDAMNCNSGNYAAFTVQE